MTASRVRVRPTRRLVMLGLGALALFGVGTNVQAGWVLAIAALLAGALVVGTVLPLRGLRGVEVARRAPRSASASRPVPVSLFVTNTSRRARGLLRLTDDFCGTGAAVVPFLRAGQTREYAADREGARRGVYEGGRCLVETGMPFGAVRASRRLTVGSPIVVYPATYQVSPGVLRRIVSSLELSSEGDVSSVREYRPGDPLRRIHWRSSARRGHLVVHELEQERRADVSVAVDVPADPDLADAVASVACSLALAAVRDGGEVALMSPANGGAETRRVRTSDAVLDWGARLEAGSAGLGDLVDRSEGTGATLCVCSPASGVQVERLYALVGRSPALVVLVHTEEDTVAPAAQRLRAAGATVATVLATEVETWFRNDCAAS